MPSIRHIGYQIISILCYISLIWVLPKLLVILIGGVVLLIILSEIEELKDDNSVGRIL